MLSGLKVANGGFKQDTYHKHFRAYVSSYSKSQQLRNLGIRFFVQLGQAVSGRKT
jgi:hypothetical protein